MPKTYFTLDKWFGKSDPVKICSGNKVFYGNLLENKIEWLNKEPTNALIIGSFKWDSDVNLCLTKESIILLKHKIKIKKNSFFSRKSILKSNLQKCVRRCIVDKAVNTAFQMCFLKNGLNELLRRLIIITVEDSLVTYDITKLCFLMCISSKMDIIKEKSEYIEISEYVLKFCLRYTSFIAQIKLWDPSYNFTNANKLTKNIITKSDLINKDKTLLMCLLTRACYGGMKGDIKMLNSIAYVWFNRLSNGNINRWHNMLSLDCKNEEVELVNKFNKKSIIKYAIDFHCTNIIKELKEYFPNYLEEELKKAIWFYSSSINLKYKIVPYFNSDRKLYLSVWQDIEQRYYKKKLKHM